MITVFRNFNVRWSFLRLTLILLALINFGFLNAQTREVRGIIMDEQGPVTGATIVLESNPNVGTVSDFNGNFSIKVSNSDVLVINFIGYETQKIKVNGNNFFNITLKQSSEMLDEVTIVAFGKQKKESVVGSISTVKPANLRVPSNNLTSALGGRIAGLMSMQTSGQPGADNAEFFVRGVTTFNEYSRGPLILIDNMELSTDDLARLSVDDIESFSILKDATSTALYGSRGANGVILVTTKGGKEGPTKLNVRFENAFSMPTKTVDLVDPVTYMKLNNEAIITRHPYYNRRYTDEQIEGVRSGADPYYYPSNDWIDLLFKDFTVNQNLNVSLSGGGKNLVSILQVHLKMIMVY